MKTFILCLCLALGFLPACSNEDTTICGTVERTQLSVTSGADYFTIYFANGRTVMAQVRERYIPVAPKGKRGCFAVRSGPSTYPFWKSPLK
jgi:hypothetical protein